MDGGDDGGTVGRTVTIVNVKGLHARAAAKFVRCAAQFDAAVEVMRDGAVVDGTSIMGLLMLGAARGAQIRIEARGHEADLAVESLCRLVADRFDED